MSSDYKSSTSRLSQNIDLPFRYQLIRSYPLFSQLSDQDINDLAPLMQEVSYDTGSEIVKEGDFVDSFFIIAAGKAKVIQKQDIFLATLQKGESIGMTTTGFFSSSGKRTATVVALTNMVVLRLDINSFNKFLKSHSVFDSNLEELTELMLKLDFIKQAYPFINLNNEKIYSVTQKIKEVSVSAGAIIFQQGDSADCCYLIRTGQVEIFLPQKEGSAQHLAILTAPELFGEAALLGTGERNASARAIEECHLFILDRALLFELIETSKPFSQSILGFLLKRFRPTRNKNIIIHQRTTKDHRNIITLQNTQLEQYYNLNEKSLFIWEQLDGLQTVQDITITFFKKYKVFAPDMICDLLYSLAEAGFVNIPPISAKLTEEETQPKTFWKKLLNKFNKFMQVEFNFTHTDPWLSKIYRGGIWLFYTWPLQLFLIAFIIFGFGNFLHSYPRIIQKAQTVHLHFWLFVLCLIPISTIAIFLHEGGHAFTAKKLGYKVQRIGLGWFWFAPIAFTDTSELWLAKQRSRIIVDIAGVYVDLLTAGFLTILASLQNNTKFAVFLWLFSLLIYYNAFKNMSPVREYDGYSLMTDVLDYPGLRKTGIKWLVNLLVRGFAEPGSIKKHKPELYYWIACIAYLLISTFLIFIILQLFFKIFSINSILHLSSYYVSLTLAILSMIMSILSIFFEIRRYISS